MAFQADDIVGIPAQFIERRGWRNRHRQQDPLGLTRPGRKQRSPHRGACRDSVIDHDGGSPFAPNRRAIAEIAVAPALDFLALALAHGSKFRIGCPDESDDLLVADHGRPSSLRDRSHRELELLGNADLAGNDEVQRRVQRGGDLGGNRTGCSRR